MKINKEKSKGIKTVVAISLASMIAVGSGVCVNNNLDEDEYLKAHFDFEKKKIEYLNNVENADMSLYNPIFVDYYRDGIFCVNDKSFEIKTMCLLYRDVDGQRQTFLVSYKEPNFDLLSQSEFERSPEDELYSLRTTEAFYELFLKYGVSNNMMEFGNDDLAEVESILLSSSGQMHDMVPETYYKNHR